jgi:hypothetical protein
MSTYSVISEACEMPIVDAQRHARPCGNRATTTRDLSDVTFSACDLCAANHDAYVARGEEPRGRVETPTLDTYVDRARRRGTYRANERARMRRIVLRMDADVVARIDAMLPRFPDASRASLVRAFCLFGLAAAEASTKRTP